MLFFKDHTFIDIMPHYSKKGNASPSIPKHSTPIDGEMGVVDSCSDVPISLSKTVDLPLCEREAAAYRTHLYFVEF